MTRTKPAEDLTQRIQVTIEGTVQGVGFRPFVYRLARELGLGGWIRNATDGLVIEVEGAPRGIETFLRRLRSEAPPAATVESITHRMVPVQGTTAFAIVASLEEGRRALVIPPDLAVCSDCLREFNDLSDRRFRYPFLTCTQCGPRYSLITDLPYDRRHTTMSRFPLCRACQTEYETMENRRFHAEPIACPACGPQVMLWDHQGREMARGDEARDRAITLLREGAVVAVKGLGGFQLWVDAQSEEAVQRLRARKRRPEKPFALLFPSLEVLRLYCLVSQEEAALLASPQAPIVLLRRSHEGRLAESVAPGCPFLGAMLPTTPLHHWLMGSLDQPVVATSGNRSEEPIVIDEQKALIRLGGIADVFLVHDRPIARPVDDSVVRGCPDRTDPSSPVTIMILRRARGYAPSAVRLKGRLAKLHGPVLAVGGHLKNTVSLLDAGRVWVSQHLGDLSTLEADHAFRQAVEDLQRLLRVTPTVIACDLHPDYRSSIFARELAVSLSVPLAGVQHHHAHVASCMAEQGLDGEVLGVAWDGAGYGVDGSIWGGEFLLATVKGFTRFAHLRPFRLPGGEAALREPPRTAAAVLWETMGNRMVAQSLPSWGVPFEERERLVALLQSRTASPKTTSVGRLFDAVASLAGLCQKVSFEGQAAMVVEYAAERHRTVGKEIRAYRMDVAKADSGESHLVVDWRPMVSELVRDLREGISAERIAARFHGGLADVCVRVAQAAGLPRVVLTGGCFQNSLLLSMVRQRLEAAGFTVYAHRLVPPNDGGLSLGQAVVAACQAADGQCEREE
ncbi:MAG: carbamoyltransferase HypF [Nitrospira sp.]|nr:carbamoyltransferase HypF [Nitrospira sp.]